MTLSDQRFSETDAPLGSYFTQKQPSVLCLIN